MSRKRSEEAINAYRDRFLDGAVAQGVERAIADRVFEQIRGFSGFGFPKSHAAAFGLLAYQSTWLRVHRGPEFLCALLNEQPMGFYPPDALVHEAQRRGIEVRGPDVNASGVECTVEPDLGVRIGLGYVTGLREDDAAAIVAERDRCGAYRSLGELASRAGVRGEALERLAWAGACESAGAEEAAARRPALWRLGIAEGIGPNGQLSLPLDLPEAPELAELGQWDLAVADYSSTGMTLGAHPLALMRPQLEGLATSEDTTTLPEGTSLEVAGIVVARQRPATARGVVFMLLEDELGVINVIVPPPVYSSCRLAVRTASFARVRGRLERQGKRVVNVVAARVEPLATPDLTLAEVRPLEPPVERETGRQADPDEEPALAAAAGGLAAVAPKPHSFGRRGR
jgi:error-prone DNA polymerase